MLEEFEKFAMELGADEAESPLQKESHQCPNCREILTDAYLEQTPFPEVPCSSCGSLVTIRRLHSTEESFIDKRTEKRCSVSLKVSYRTFDEFIDEYTKNVSRRGMFIKTTRHHTHNEIAEILLHVPELPYPVRIKGEIVHIDLDSENTENCGVGVKFIDIDDQSRGALIAFIKSREDCE